MDPYRNYYIYAAVVFIVGMCTFYVKQVSTPNSVIEYTSNNNTYYEQPELITIHLAGAVQFPGVYKVNHGSRLIDILSQYSPALESANFDKVNLAKIVKDGQRIYIPLKQTTLSKLSTTYPLNKLININTAKKSHLKKLPGVGPKIATEIISYRNKNGFFYKKEDLLNVKYIGHKLLEKIKHYITI